MTDGPLNDVATKAGDAVAAGITVATVFKYLPAIAALLTIVWTAIRIYETRTVQKIICKCKEVCKIDKED